MDMELVRRAKCEVLRRLDRIPRVSEKLADFRRRCARLAAAGWRVIPQAVPAEQEEKSRMIAAGD